VWLTHFAVDHDPTGLRAERNTLRYRPFPRGVLLRGEGADVDLAVVAARRAGTPVTVSRVEDERDEDAIARLAETTFDRLRVLGPLEPALRAAALDVEVTLDDAPFVAEPRVELARWVREQAVSETRHRHGNLMP
jgi:RHH-type proline utilization regulon transcriptional repressor/proline dehydrogenase/delta 1-pyrroline-5-carboxylate dehydrogenase